MQVSVVAGWVSRLVAFLVKMAHPANTGAPQTGF